MRSSRIASLIVGLSLFTISGFANSTKTNTEAIPITDGASRHSLTLDTETNDIILQDLKRGESYKIFIGSDFNNCLPFFIVDDVNSPFVLEFEARAEEEIVQIGRPCDFPIEIRFSIACTTCDRPDSDRNLMGIMVDENFTAEQLIEDVFISGDCFDVVDGSISSIGDPLSRGYFSSGNSSINLEDGIILSTGNIHSCEGANDVYNAGNSFFNLGGEVDLSQMVGSDYLYDLTSIEFDFTPTTDQVSFDFVFASEEYCEYANSSFNDVFGFFISGPGINGPFSNNAENIAIVPNTNSYTSINSVNHLNNSAFYVNNIPIAQHADIPNFLQCDQFPINQNGVAVNDIEYDGFTTSMTAMANVQACETYHIKLVIADVSDGYFDSAVFLKANSFGTEDIAEVTTEAPGGVDANVAFENCEEGYFVFQRTNEDLTQPLVVNYTISALSTATFGVDYAPFPNSVTIPAGDSVYYLPITVYDDLMPEGQETIRLDLEAPCSCDQPYVLMFIDDVEPLAVVAEDLLFCDPVDLSIEPTISGGQGNYTYLWNTGDTTAMLNVFADNNALYTLIVTDECGNTEESTTNISIIESPSAIISGDDLVCPESPLAQIQIDFIGAGPWDLIYTIDNVAQPVISGIMDNPYILETTSLGNFQLQSVSTLDCLGDVQGSATIAPVNLIIDFNATDESCPTTEDGTISIDPNGGSIPYSFLWDNGLGAVEDPTGLAAGIYEVIVTDNNGCSSSQQIEVYLDPNVPMSSAGSDKTLNCNEPTVTLTGNGSPGSNFSYEWTTSDGNIVSGDNTLTPVVDQIGTYNLNVTNLNTNCMVTDKTEVFIDTISPIAVADVLGPLVLNCIELTTTLDASGSMPAGNLSFEWTTIDGNIESGANTINPEVNAGGMYTLTITNTTNGCTDTESVTVGSNTELPTIDILAAELLTCYDSVIVLQAGNSSSGTNYTILWTSDDGNIISGENTLLPAVDQPGNYVLTIFNTSNDCSNTASVLVAEDREPPIADAGLPTELDCNDEVVTLDGSESSIGPNFNYLWSSIDGVFQSETDGLNPEVSTSGSYFLQVINTENGCTAEDVTQVFQDPDVPNAADIEIVEPECFGDEAIISIATVYGGETPYVYSIDGGQNFYNENIFRNLNPGIFNVAIQDADGCLHEEQVFINDVPELIVVVDSVAEISLGDTYQIDASVSIPEFLIDTILWTPNENLNCRNCLDPIAFPLQTTSYQITVTDQNGCPASAEVLIRVDKNRDLFIPNAFSPNGDGTNDHFMIFAKEGLVTNIASFQVFNRWGGKVFETRNGVPNTTTFGWDGTMKGELMNPAVFIYYAEIEFIDGEKRMYKGDVTITN